MNWSGMMRREAYTVAETDSQARPSKAGGYTTVGTVGLRI